MPMGTYPPSDATRAKALEVFWREAGEADRIYDGASLEEIEHSDRAFYSVRY